MGGEAGEPSDDELIRFAKELLGLSSPFADEDLLRETVRDAHELWVHLYQASQSPPPPPT